MWFQLIRDWGNISNSFRMQTLFYCVAITFHIPIILEIFRKREELSKLYNSFVTFEEVSIKNISNLCEDNHLRIFMAKLFGNLLVVTAPSVTGLIFLQLYWIPCLPATVQYILLQECGNDSLNYIFNLVFKFILLVFTNWLFLFTCTGVFLEYGFYSYIHCYCLLHYLKILKKRLELNSSVLSTQDVYKIYRQVQLLAFCYNDIHKRILTMVTTALLQFVCIIGLFALIKFGGELIQPQFLMFAGLVVESVLYIFDSEGGVKASVFSASKDLLHSRNCVSIGINQNSKWVRRFTKSLPVLKIQFGSGNYFDELTPLVLIDFSINQTVSLLLM
ncbi:unnamed protein product [Orchesella dallaii]|uniref:Odorant receptor n=1 Tax=Orchesella dallaii TaxID=48710 RepID=A0ABP1RP36_9HEXA